MGCNLTATIITLQIVNLWWDAIALEPVSRSHSEAVYQFGRQLTRYQRRASSVTDQIIKKCQ